MAAPINDLTAEAARALLSYDPDTGQIFWRVYRTGGINAGDLAGTCRRGKYLRVQLCGRAYAVHRIAWLITFGQWPASLLDHINGITTDNRIENLREATSSQNQWNKPMATRNKAGVKGVYPHPRGGWGASIKTNGRRFYYGPFDSVEEAAEARKAAAMIHFGERRHEADL